MTIFGEDEWKGPLVCVKRWFKHQNKALNGLQVKLKEEYHGIMMVWNSWLIGDNYNQWRNGYKWNGATKSVWISQDEVDSVLPIVTDQPNTFINTQNLTYLCKVASLPYLHKYLSNAMMCNIHGR